MGNLEKFAEDELRAVGLFDKDSDYGGMMGEAVMKLIRVFAEEGHSGFSASMAISLFSRLASWKPLTPITNNPDEWNDVSNLCANGKPLWQSKKDSECFSEDGGETYYNLNSIKWIGVGRFKFRYRKMLKSKAAFNK